MDELIAFLRACLDEDERVARAVPVGEICAPPAHWATGADPGGEETWVLGTYEDINAHTPAAADHVARHDPARVLREVEAKRRILDEHQPEDGSCSRCGRDSREENPGAHLRGEPEMVDVWRPAIWPCRTTRLLAMPYDDHKNYRQEWKP